MTKVIKNTLVLLAAAATIVLVTVLSLLPPQKLPDTRGWFSAIPFMDKIVHFVFYFGAVTAIRFAKTYFTGFSRSCRWRLLIMAALYGGAIELLQGQYFGRGCELWDEVANVLGAIVAIWAIPQGWHERVADRVRRH